MAARGTRRWRGALSLVMTLVLVTGLVPAQALEETLGGEDAIAVEEVEPREESSDAEADVGEEIDPVEVDALEIEPVDEGAVPIAEEEGALESANEDVEVNPVAGQEDVEEASEAVEDESEEVALGAQAVSVSDPRVRSDSSVEAGQVVTWDCVWLGSYPQTEVTASDAEYVSLEAASWDSKGDATVGGKRYRRYCRISGGDATSDYFWYDDGYGSATYRYFRWEPVKWRVLEANGSSALVVADVALDDQCYDTDGANVTWETCSVRSWLNGYGAGSNQPGTDFSSKNFFDAAFSSAQKSAVLQTAVANADNQYYGTDGGSDTSDRVFLLAESDVFGSSATRHGFASNHYTLDEARRCRTSDYALAMGTELSSSPGYENCFWWLRSPGYYQSSAAYVNNDGSVNRFGNIVFDNRAVRPALNLNLTSSAVSSAGTVSSNGTVNEQAASGSGGSSTSHDISNARVSSISVQTYTGDPIEPEFTVCTGLSNLLMRDRDYTLAYADNVEVGTATVTITGTGDYHGTITRKFEIRSQEDGVLGALDLSAGFGSLKLDLDESVPIIGGESFSLDMPVTLPAQVVVEDGLIKFGYNLPAPYLKGSNSSAQPKKAWEWVTGRKSMKQQWESFCKDARKGAGMLRSSLSDKDGFLGKISDGRWQRWNVPGMQRGVEMYASLYGEYAYGDKLTDAASIEGSLVIVAKGTVSLQKQFVVWVVPVTVNCDFSASATATASIGYDVTNAEWYGDLDLALAIGIEPYAGVGVGKWASVGVYGSAETGVDIKILGRREARGLREWYLSGEAGGRVYFAQKAFTWTMISTADLRGGSLGKYVDSGGHLRLWSKTQASVITGSKGAALGTQSEDEEADEAEELLSTAETVPLEAQSTLQAASADGSLVMEAYPGAEPAVVDAGDTRLLVYVGQDPSRADLDRTVLYYRVYDGASDSWSDPAPVLDDGTADCMPTVLADGGEAYVAWLDANKRFGANAEASPDEYLTAFSARVARWDAAEGCFADLGRPAGTKAPYTYLLALGEGPTLTWAENADGAAFGVGSAANEVRQASWNGGSWSAPATLASGLNAVTSLAANGSDAAWSADEDNDISTPGQAVGSTWGALPPADVASLAYVELPGASGTSLAAAIDGGICGYDGSAWAEVLPPGTMGAASDFCVDGDSVYYVRADEDSSHVAVATWDSGEWGTALVTTDDGYVSSLSCPCGTVALTHTSATPVEDTSEWETTSEVRVLTTTQRADVALDAVDFASEDLVPGSELPVTLHVTNGGTSRATAAYWRASLDGAEVASGTGEIDLMPGASGSFVVDVPLPDDLGSGALTFKAWCDGDDDESDGAVEEAILRPDLDVTTEFFEAVPGEDGDEVVKATLRVTVRNAGTADASATTTVSTENGGELLSKVETIAAGESAIYTMEPDDATLPADGTEVVLVARASCDVEEFYESNNVDYVTASSRSVNSEGETVDDGGDSGNPTSPKDLSAATVTVSDQIYNGSAHEPAPTVTLDGTTLVAGTDYTVSYGNNVNAGTATVTVTGTGCYEGATTGHFTIAKAAQTITAADKSVAIGRTVALGATASGGGFLTYRSSDALVAKVSATGVVTPVKVGTCKVTVSAAATPNYKAVSKTITVTVTKGDSTVKLAAQTKTYTGNALTYSGAVTRTGSTGGITYKYYSDSACTKAVAAANVKAAGTYYVKATVAADANHKSATSSAVKLTIAKAASTIKLAAQTKAYAGKAQAYSGKVTRTGSSGKVTYKYYSDAKCTKAVAAANVKAAGTYYVKATVAADANHKSATSSAVKLTIAKAANPLAVKATAKTVSYSKVRSAAQTVAPLAVTKAQGTKSFSVAKWTTAKAKKYLTLNKSTGKVTAKKGTPKGTYKFQVKVTAKGGANYNAGTKTVTVTIVIK